MAPNTGIGFKRGGICRLVALLALGVSSVAAQTLPRFDFQHLHTEDGLPHPNVWDVHQDPVGFIWVAGQDGLARFDGLTFKSYRQNPGDPSSLIANDVYKIWQGPEGGLWLNVLNRLQRFDPATERFKTFPLDGDGQVLVQLHVDPGAGLWVATQQRLYRFRPQIDAFEAVDGLAQGPAPDGTERLFALADGRPGELWIGAWDGLYLYDLEHETWERFMVDGERPAGPVRSIGAAADGTLWIGGDQGIHELDPPRRSLADYAVSSDGLAGAAPFGEVYGWTGLENGKVKVVTRTGLHAFDTETRHWHPLGDPLELSGAAVLAEDADGVWIGDTQLGIYRWSDRHGRFFHLTPDPSRATSLSGHSPNDIFIDRLGVVWIATQAGIDKYLPQGEQFQVEDRRSGLSDVSIRMLHEDRRGTLWIGTRQGLARLEPGARQVVRYGPEHGLDGEILSAAETTDGRLWINAQDELVSFDTDRRPQLVPKERFGWAPHDIIDVLLADRSGHLWIGGPTGVTRLNVETFEHTHFAGSDLALSSPRSAVGDLLEDHAGSIWISSVEGGLSRLDPRTGEVLRIPQDPVSAAADEGLAGGGVVDLYEDDDGVLWIGTYGGGLSSLSRDRRDLRRHALDDGSGSPSVLRILPDDTGHLWLSTYDAIYRFHRGTGAAQRFGTADGLPAATFSSWSATRRADGRLLFGSDHGFISFHPDEVRSDPWPPEPVLTDLKIFHRATTPGVDGLLTEPITTTRDLVLDHRHYVFSLEIAALHFAGPKQNTISHRLDPFDEGWITDTARHSAQYSNLAPGSYVFRYRAANPSGVESDEKTLRIRVLPAPWKSPWAYGLYSVLLVSVIVGGGFVYRHKLQRERRISEQLRQVDRMKDQLLANTSHELRTPLQGIIGLAESLKAGAGGDVSPAMAENLSMIADSGLRLSRLVDDILDFSSLQTRGELRLETRAVDLRQAVDSVLALCRPTANGRNLQLLNTVPADLQAAEADPNRLQQILFNLVGNAVKFTRSGSITVSARPVDGRLRVEVADTGIGIEEQDRQRIFDAFVQVDGSMQRRSGGTGLGLALTLSLVRLHGGDLRYAPRPGGGSCFYFDLGVSGEVTGNARTPSPIQDPVQASPPLPEARSQDLAARPLSQEAARATILVVDDEPVNLQVISNYLSLEGYAFHLASDGQEALILLQKHDIDLVLLDVMMPDLSGLDVCREIRRSRSLESLPVVFLSALSRPEERTEGLACGGNDYLLKPVTQHELAARLDLQLSLLQVHRSRSRQITHLRGMLPICMRCKKIRDDDGYWEQMEVYISEHSNADFSHGICPACATTVLAELAGDGAGAGDGDGDGDSASS